MAAHTDINISAALQEAATAADAKPHIHPTSSKLLETMKRKLSESDAAAPKAAAPKKMAKAAPPQQATGMTEADRKKQLKKLATDSQKAIKKTGHTQNSKPYTEWRTGMDRATALALLGSHGQVLSDTPKNHKRSFSPAEIIEWLPMPQLIQGVKFTGKCWILPGMGKPKFAAEFESLEVKHDGSTLILKFRTLIFRGVY